MAAAPFVVVVLTAKMEQAGAEFSLRRDLVFLKLRPVECRGIHDAVAVADWYLAGAVKKIRFPEKLS